VLKPDVGQSRRNRRLTVAVRDILSAAGSRACRFRLRRTATQQIELLESIGISYAKFNRIRVFFGGASSPLASPQSLQQARSAVLKMLTNDVAFLDSGAHLSHLCCAV